jgi:hypothetical protein
MPNPKRAPGIAVREHRPGTTWPPTREATQVQTVATEHAFGTVDWFATRLRASAPHWTDIRLCGMEFIKVIASNRYPGEEVQDVERIRNILAAVEIVRAELAEATR